MEGKEEQEESSPSERQRAARERLLELARRFTDRAAGGVLRETLGLDAFGSSLVE